MDPKCEKQNCECGIGLLALVCFLSWHLNLALRKTTFSGSRLNYVDYQFIKELEDLGEFPSRHYIVLPYINNWLGFLKVQAMKTVQIGSGTIKYICPFLSLKSR